MSIIEILNESVPHRMGRCLIAVNILEVESCAGQSVLHVMNNSEYLINFTVSRCQWICWISSYPLSCTAYQSCSPRSVPDEDGVLLPNLNDFASQAFPSLQTRLSFLRSFCSLPFCFLLSALVTLNFILFAHIL